MTATRTHRKAIAGLIAIIVAAVLAPAAPAHQAVPPVDITVSQDFDHILLRCHLEDFTAEDIGPYGEMLRAVQLASDPLTKQPGDFALPRIRRSLIIPDDAKMTVNILEARFIELPADLVSLQETSVLNAGFDEAHSASGGANEVAGFHPGHLARLGEPYILRDFRGIVLTLLPCQYDSTAGILRVYTDVTVEVLPVGPGEVNVLKRDRNQHIQSHAFNQLYGHHFVNHRQNLRYPPLNEEGGMLIITHDPWIPNVEPLAQHKTNVGIDTTVVGVSTIGNNSTAIQAYIQSVYDTTDVAFVLLVGATRHRWPPSPPSVEHPTQATLKSPVPIHTPT